MADRLNNAASFSDSR